ncbi:MAG: AI-2E family transporter, partial [Sinorhizobium fredii]|nr:AI-2E family transporter [Sinorhizobium fredii]
MGNRISGFGLQRQIFFWLLVLAAFIAFLMVFSSILLPFLAGMALAYFLDPVADRLQRLGLSRLMATIAILVAFIVLFALSLIIVIPLIFTQAADFIQKMPGYVARLQA